MKWIDKVFPVVPWEVFINGTSLGIYHARTAWAARRFHRLFAKKIPRVSVPTETKGENSLVKEYTTAIEDGLNYNLANPQQLSDYFCVEISFTKTLKGKEFNEHKTFGVVHKDEIDLFKNCWNADILNARIPPHITNIRLHTWQMLMNHRVSGRRVTNESIIEKYGVTACDVALKKLRTL